MCGIIGIVGKSEVANRLVDGLSRLEYRGYDSSGIATIDGGKIERCRAEGKLINLAEKLNKAPLRGTIGIGHTRWATHGGPSEKNAHPHATDKVAVVHNGIIENYAALKAELEQAQCRFVTDTDTEVVAHLVTHNLNQGMAPVDAANAAFDRLEGAYALAIIFANENDLMVGTRQGTPLAVGYGEGEMYLASDSYALAPLTKKIAFLDDGDRVQVSKTGVRIYRKDGQVVERPVRITAQSGGTTGKGEFRHFMLKEIYEQPTAIGDTLNSFVNPATRKITIADNIVDALDKAPRLTLIGCGTAYYACVVAKYWFEQIARIPCEVDIASEFRYREGPMPKDGMAIFISQSGETLDTLEAMRYCQRQGQTTMCIVNTIESTMERTADLVMHMLAGPEIGVASTKAYTTHLTTLACLALALADRRKSQPEDKLAEMAEALRHLPALVNTVIKGTAKQIEKMSIDLRDSRDAIYLGRGLMCPTALEGALKLKEVSYIHAEGYGAGELKHGPIALIDHDVPVVIFAPSDALFEKTASNAQEVAARGGQMIIISDAAGMEKFGDTGRWNITMPDAHPFVTPMLYIVPAQLLAYYVAVAKGTDVDQPRNLAKSVTVE